jgi:hypothetical protein
LSFHLVLHNAAHTSKFECNTCQCPTSNAILESPSEVQKDSCWLVFPHMNQRNTSNACLRDAKSGEMYLDHLDHCHGKKSSTLRHVWQKPEHIVAAKPFFADIKTKESNTTGRLSFSLTICMSIVAVFNSILMQQLQ